MEKRENKEVQPSTRRRLQGIVVSNKMQKTIVVETENYIKYPVYKKRVSIRKKYKVDDKKEIARVGDLVIIEECLPLSQDKRFRLVQIIKKGESK
jgi:small subunit ribosomal protein S17